MDFETHEEHRAYMRGFAQGIWFSIATAFMFYIGGIILFRILN